MSTWFVTKINKKDPNLVSYFEKYGKDVCHDKIDYEYIEKSINFFKGYIMTNSQGGIGCFLVYHEFKDNTVYIKLICSNPKYRGSNHCKTLMNYFIEECRNEGKKAITLTPISETAELYYVLNFNFKPDEDYSYDLILNLRR